MKTALFILGLATLIAYIRCNAVAGAIIVESISPGNRRLKENQKLMKVLGTRVALFLLLLIITATAAVVYFCFGAN